MSDCKVKNEVEKDVCDFYGISHEQYDNIVRGIGITDALKKYSIEIDEAKIKHWKIKRAFKGLFRNKNTPLCDMCEYSGCLKCKIAKFTRCAHLFKADCYNPKSE